DVRLLLDRDVNPLRNVEHDRMCISKREDDLFSLELRAIADADDVEFLLEAFGDPRDGVRNEASSEPVELRQLWIFRRTLGHQVAVRHREIDAARERLRQLPFWPLHLNGAVVQLHRDALWHDDRFFSDSRHLSDPCVLSPWSFVLGKSS